MVTGDNATPQHHPETNAESAGTECPRGPWPFVTHAVRILPDGARRVWSSRHHRKGLALPGREKRRLAVDLVAQSLWMPAELNWWIGGIFAIGALLFTAASVLSLAPSWASALALSPLQVNAIYFAGSIPFTTAAFLQLFQAANAVDPGAPSLARPRTKILGWHPENVGWLSCALQFAGTILFNFNTFDALVPSLTWFQQDLLVWVPNILGSILFLASGCLAFSETCHAWWGWKPGEISWWIVFINLLGCLCFMGSALCALTLPGPVDSALLTAATALTLLGAICFLVGSLLLLPEAAAGVDAAVPE